MGMGMRAGRNWWGCARHECVRCDVVSCVVLGIGEDAAWGLGPLGFRGFGTAGFEGHVEMLLVLRLGSGKTLGLILNEGVNEEEKFLYHTLSHKSSLIVLEFLPLCMSQLTPREGFFRRSFRRQHHLTSGPLRQDGMG